MTGKLQSPCILKQARIVSSLKSKSPIVVKKNFPCGQILGSVALLRKRGVCVIQGQSSDGSVPILASGYQKATPVSSTGPQMTTLPKARFLSVSPYSPAPILWISCTAKCWSLQTRKCPDPKKTILFRFSFAFQTRPSQCFSTFSANARG